MQLKIDQSSFLYSVFTHLYFEIDSYFITQTHFISYEVYSLNIKRASNDALRLLTNHDIIRGLFFYSTKNKRFI